MKDEELQKQNNGAAAYVQPSHRSSFGSSRNAPQREAETRHERPRGRLELPDGAKSFAFCS